jgi:hypothetical protein
VFESIKSGLEFVFHAHPYLSFMAIWGLWAAGAYWELRWLKNRQVAIANWVFLLGVLCFWIVMIDDLGAARWPVALVAVGIGSWAIRLLLRFHDSQNEIVRADGKADIGRP